MSYAQVAGYPDYSSGGATKFKNAVWSGKLIKKFYEASVIADISSTDYDGSIKEQGDMVYIRTIPDFTIRNYVKGQKIEYDNPEGSPAVDLLIDNGKYFAFTCDDVDRWQMDEKLLSTWSSDAAEQLKVEVDADVMSAVYTQADADNIGATAGAVTGSIDLGATGTPADVTKSNVMDYIIDCATVLDEQNVPHSQRWLVIPSWFAGMIKKSDLVNAPMSDPNSYAANGRIGSIDRFTVYTSNHLKTVVDGGDTAYYILFGHKQALTFASDVIKVETLRAESTFGNLVRGLQVYGYKVIKPDAFGVLYAIRGTSV